MTTRDRNLAAYLLTTLAQEPPAGFAKALAAMLRTERQSARGIAPKDPPVAAGPGTADSDSEPGLPTGESSPEGELGRAAVAGGDSWKTRVEQCKAEGGVLQTPNDLPVGCIRHDGLMLECEHGDHADYRFPITARLIGEPERIEGHPVEGDETHALIYTDGNVALTLHECTYYLWHLSRGGKLLSGPTRYEVERYRLDAEDVQKVIAHHSAPSLSVDVSFDLSPEVHDAMDKMIEGLGPEMMSQAAAVMPEHLPAHWQALKKDRDEARAELLAVDKMLGISKAPDSVASRVEWRATVLRAFQEMGEQYLAEIDRLTTERERHQEICSSDRDNKEPAGEIDRLIESCCKDFQRAIDDRAGKPSMGTLNEAARSEIVDTAIAWVRSDGRKNEPTPVHTRAAAAMETDRLLKALHRLAVDYAYDSEHGTFPEGKP